MLADCAAGRGTFAGIIGWVLRHRKAMVIAYFALLHILIYQLVYFSGGTGRAAAPPVNPLGTAQGTPALPKLGAWSQEDSLLAGELPGGVFQQTHDKGVEADGVQTAWRSSRHRPQPEQQQRRRSASRHASPRAPRWPPNPPADAHSAALLSPASTWHELQSPALLAHQR